VLNVALSWVVDQWISFAMEALIQDEMNKHHHIWSPMVLSYEQCFIPLWTTPWPPQGLHLGAWVGVSWLYLAMAHHQQCHLS
jgi:hypothetical protein